MDVTDEIRRAVYARDCESFGHLPDFGDVASGTDRPNPNDPRGFPMTVLRARDASRLPHVTCIRCGGVALVIDEWGTSYDDAVARVAARCSPLKPGRTAPLTPRPVPGTAETPIPLADGVVWEEIPEDHPAKQFLRMEEETARVHSGEQVPPAAVDPDPDAEPPPPGHVEVISTEPPQV